MDETFCQLIKQTSSNPRNDSDSRGWELIVACVYKCVPSPKLLPFLRFHVTRRMKESTPRGSLAFRTWQRLLGDSVPKLPSSVREGHELSRTELDTIKAGSPPQTIFGVTLNEVLRLEHNIENPDDDTPLRKANDLNFVKRPLVPVVVRLLTEVIKTHGGMETEGLFRLAADQDDVEFFKDKIAHGDYSCLRDPPPPEDPDGPAAAAAAAAAAGGAAKLTDVHVAANLLKIFLRELTYPLVPFEQYAEAVQAGTSNDAAPALEVIRKVPMANQRTLRHLTALMHQLSSNAEVTKMSVANTALTIAPNIIHHNSQSGRFSQEEALQFANAQANEQKFVEHLITAANWSWK